MKKIVSSMALALAASVAVADDAFTFVNDGDYGYSYIQINQDLDSFSFKSDWHSLGNAGRVGYVVYTSDMSADDMAAYMEANANNPQFRKSVNGGVVDLGALKAGYRMFFTDPALRASRFGPAPTDETARAAMNRRWLEARNQSARVMLPEQVSFDSSFIRRG